MSLTIVKTNYADGLSCAQCFFLHKTCPVYADEPFCKFLDDDLHHYHFEQVL